MVEDWISTKVYDQHDVVTHENKIYFSLVDKNGGFKPTFITPKLTRDITISDKWVSEDYFVWEPSYTTNVDRVLTTEEVTFGDNYSKVSEFGISNLAIIGLNLVFDRRTNKEAFAIASFLENKGGERFIFKAPAPYNQNFYFICRSWEVTQVFKDDNTVTATFEEVGVGEPKAEFNKSVILDTEAFCDFSCSNSVSFLNVSTCCADPDGDFGDSLFVFYAENSSDEPEEFVVKGEVYTFDVRADIPDNTSEYLYKPINFNGMVLGFAKISRSAGPKPSPCSEVRTYNLDGIDVAIWVEAFGTKGSLYKNSDDADGYVTPQYFPIIRSIFPNEIAATSYTFVDTALGRTGKFDLQTALSHYWLVDTWNFRYSALFNFRNDPVEQITKEQFFGFSVFPDGTTLNNLIQLHGHSQKALSEKTTLGLFTANTVSAALENPSFKDKVAFKLIFTYLTGVKFHAFVPTFSHDPVGLQPNLYGPGPYTYGSFTIDKIDVDNPLMEVNWFTSGVHKAGTVEIKPNSYRRVKLPAWLAPNGESDRCFNSLASNYERSLLGKVILS